MSIVPVGRYKKQVNQGDLRNKHLINGDLLCKLAQGASGLIDHDINTPKQTANVPDDLQNVMNTGGLDHDHQADMQGPKQWESSLQSPAASFLGNVPTKENQPDPNSVWKMERSKIRQFIGSDFSMTLRRNPDGSFTVTLQPPQGTPIRDPSGFIDALLQHIGGASVDEESTPALTDRGGAITLKYRPSGTNPEKIRPRGRRR